MLAGLQKGAFYVEIFSFSVWQRPGTWYYLPRSRPCLLRCSMVALGIQRKVAEADEEVAVLANATS